MKVLISAPQTVGSTLTLSNNGIYTELGGVGVVTVLDNVGNVLFTKDDRFNQPPGPVPIPVPTPTPTPPGAVLVDLHWLSQQRPGTKDFQDQAYCFRITVPPDIKTYPTYNPDHKGFFKYVEQAVPMGRDVAFSKTPGNFDTPEYLKALNGGTAGMFTWTIGNPNWRTIGANFNVEPGDVICYNIRNSIGHDPRVSNIWADVAVPTRY